MWWSDIKAAMGQRINLEGIVSTMLVVAKDKHLALPHVSVKDIGYIDWAYLKSKGFRGVVFDKDNTITVPYSLTLWQPLRSSMERCKSVFGNDIAVFSNSAGLNEFDPNGRKARALEGSIGIKVIRHTVKKPAGTAEEIEKHFGCESSRLVMVGDRPFTDIVYGNRNGFLTILTEPLSLAEEPFIVKQVRKLEIALVNQWFRRGLKPLSHRLLPDAQHCVKDPPSL
ncbi:Phosphatidylglycerophosphatase [Bertholletia excelsa]